MKSELGGGVIAVVSPHLDDAVLSLGAGIARASSRGADVRAVTVFANDPESSQPATDWDRACGFATAGEAARVRREEDRLACECVGATPMWLRFSDSDHGGEARRDDVIEGLAQALAGADVVLVPGYPLAHPDHALVTELLLAEPPRGAILGLYVEQPYATWRHVGRGRRQWSDPGLTPARGVRNLAAILLRTRGGRRLQRPVLPEGIRERLEREAVWVPVTAGTRDKWAKQRALRAYSSQFSGFGRKTAAMIALYELGWGGEGIAWVGSPPL